MNTLPPEERERLRALEPLVHETFNSPLGDTGDFEGHSVIRTENGGVWYAECINPDDGLVLDHAEIVRRANTFPALLSTIQSLRTELAAAKEDLALTKFRLKAADQGLQELDGENARLRGALETLFELHNNCGIDEVPYGYRKDIDRVKAILDTLSSQRSNGESGGQICGLCDKPKPCKCLMELESDTLPQPPQSPWRPIAEAPKDGSYVLLLEQHADAPFVGRWAREGWTAYKEHLAAYGGWEGAVIDDSFRAQDITHFMPLPQPPTKGGDES